MLPLVLRGSLGASIAGAVAFIAAFGAAKAIANLATGWAAPRFGGARTLRAGWLLALPVPFALASASSLPEIVAANVLLGASQGLVWTTALLMTLDVAGARRRGLASGLNEFAGYAATGLAAYAAAALATIADPRTGPAAVALVALVAGLGASLAVRDEWTSAAAGASAMSRSDAGVASPSPSRGRRFSRAAVAQAGLANKANDAFAWGVLPLLAAARGEDLAAIGAGAGAYAAAWSTVQLAAGPASDRLGRRPLVVLGMLAQAAAMGAFALGADVLPAALAWGAGTGLVYPTLLAAAADAASEAERPRALAGYRFWRDSGLAVGAIGGGAIATAYGLEPALWAGALATGISGVVAFRMQ